MRRSDYYEARGLDRMTGLSDGVFAFSLTLLSMELIVPELSGSGTSLLFQDLLDEYSRFVVFLLTFIITGAYWSLHHRIFRFIRGYDGILMRLNLFSLFFIILMPFITKLINQYGDTRVAVIVAAAGYAAPGLLLGFTWHYASTGHRFIDPAIPAGFVRLTTLKNYISPSVFLISIPVAFIGPKYALLFWLLLFPLHIGIDLKYPDMIEDD